MVDNPRFGIAVRKRIAILGSTGSIGKSALDVVRLYPDRFDVVALCARSDCDGLAAQIQEFQPDAVALSDASAAARLSNQGVDAVVLPGDAGVAELAARPADIVLCAMAGAAGLTPILNAIDAGSDVALANKEPLVMAGELIMERARAKGIEVLPVDSEHSAIFQCLHGHDSDEIHKIYLTASGGPFYRRPRSELENVTPAQAINHPTWDMGPKISVDSATLMNKGLEVIEAMRLFDLPLDTFEVIIHPQSLVHGLVEFTDGGILAHLGVTDMKLPIQFALTWPDRVKCPIAKLDLTTMSALTFAAPDFSEFPCLGLAMDAARLGGTTPTVLNGANEEAVSAFCQGRIAFTRIPDIVEATLNSADAPGDATLENILAADAGARRMANELIGPAGVKLA